MEALRSGRIRVSASKRRRREVQACLVCSKCTATTCDDPGEEVGRCGGGQVGSKTREHVSSTMKRGCTWWKSDGKVRTRTMKAQRWKWKWMLMVSSLHGTRASNFYLADNGVTVMCPHAEIGETGMVHGTLYTKRSRQEITMENAPTTCTSNITDMSLLFARQSQFNGNISTWDTSDVTSMFFMFAGASEFDQPIGKWNTSKVVDMAFTFAGADRFNQAIGEWDTGMVEVMSYMFADAKHFNQPIGEWDTRQVFDMEGMFHNAISFDHIIDAWDTGQVISMRSMFSGAEAFNQPLGSWDTGKVEDFSFMFEEAYSFNQPIGEWHTHQASKMEGMFKGSVSFDQDLGAWCTDHVKSFESMFQYAERFNHSIKEWNTSQVESMDFMFTRAKSFDQPLDSWNVSFVLSMTSLFEGASSFNQSLSSWDTSRVKSMSAMFKSARAFNGDIVPWNTAKVIDMSSMFQDATSFNGSIGRWDVSQVEDMKSMFWRAWSFNRELRDWNTGQVRDMSNMFEEAFTFNHTLNQWDVSKVTTMRGMFRDAFSFNQPLFGWTTVQVGDMASMFDGALTFSQNLSSWCVPRIQSAPPNFSKLSPMQQGDRPAWGSCPHLPGFPSDQFVLDQNGATVRCNDANMRSYGIVQGKEYTKRSKSMITPGNAESTCTSDITDMEGLFQGEVSFNGDIGSWDTSRVDNMVDMFVGAQSFNEDLSHWDTRQVILMVGMFQNATSFNQDLSMWCVRNIGSTPTNFSENAVSWKLPRPAWGTCPPDEIGSGGQDLGLILGVTLPMGLLLCVCGLFILLQKHKRDEETRALLLKRKHAPGTVHNPVDRKLLQLPLEGPVEVSLVVTDVKDSTTLWEGNSEVMITATSTHNRVLRKFLNVHGGYEVSVEGDGFVFAFHTPIDALCFCIGVQAALLDVKWPTALNSFPETQTVYHHGKLLFNGLRIRTAIATGHPKRLQTNPLTNEVEYIGGVFSTAKILEGLCDGGQILMDEQTFGQVQRQISSLSEQVAPDYISSPSLLSIKRSVMSRAWCQDSVKPLRLLLAEDPPIFIDCGVYSLSRSYTDIGSSALSTANVQQKEIRAVQVISTKLAPRALVFKRPTKYSQVRKEFFDAPGARASFERAVEKGSNPRKTFRRFKAKRNLRDVDLEGQEESVKPVTVVFCKLVLHNSKRMIYPHNQEMVKKHFIRHVQLLLLRSNGYQCELIDCNLVLVFPTVSDAIRWSLDLSTWVYASHNSFSFSEMEGSGYLGKRDPSMSSSMLDINGEESVRGLEYDVSIGLYEGIPTHITPHRTSGLADYFGPFVSRAARLQGVAPSGTICGPLDILQQVFTSLKNGDLCGCYGTVSSGLYDLGAFQFKGVEKHIQVGCIVTPPLMDAKLLLQEGSKGKLCVEGKGLLGEVYGGEGDSRCQSFQKMSV